MSGNIKESVIYIRTHIDYTALNQQRFGKELMNLIKPIYKSMELHAFGRRMYQVWRVLADNLQYEEPFFAFNYADDPLSWGDEKQAREIYENTLSYYDG